MIKLFSVCLIMLPLLFTLGCGSSEKKEQTGVSSTTSSQEAAAIAVLDRKAKGEEPEVPVVEAEKPAEVPAVEPEPVQKHENAHWSYVGEGGPEQWGQLDEAYGLCASGKMQSPINLKWKAPVQGGDIYLNYRAQKVEMMDDGHSVKIVFPPGSKISVNDHKYYLKQIHYHSPSEHALSGKKFPLELHFVHADDEGNLAVLGVFYKVGQTNEFIAALWKNVSLQKNQLTPVEGVLFNPIGLLPKTRTHYFYSGSLTTPPCSEGVSWNVFNTPMEMSKEQMDRFLQYYKDNYRPLQPDYGREVLNY